MSIVAERTSRQVSLCDDELGRIEHLFVTERPD